jgi:hypothetical protein
LVQPLTSVAFTVYTVVAVGVDTTGLPVVVFKSAPGLHVYVLAPAAVNVDVLPVHTVGEFAVTLKLGKGFTFTVVV